MGSRSGRQKSGIGKMLPRRCQLCLEVRENMAAIIVTALQRYNIDLKFGVLPRCFILKLHFGVTYFDFALHPGVVL